MALEDLDEYLLQKCSTTGIPLAAYTQEEVFLPPEMAENPDEEFSNPPT